MESIQTTSDTEKIVKLFEFYFGDSNLSKDRFLKKKIEESADGCNTIEKLKK
jgi:hypothetical protein